MHIVVLAGGIGGAHFLIGVRAVAQTIPGARVTAIVNVGDDVTMHGLRICPDLDSVMYTLGGAADTERGWGRAGETWVIKDELARYGAEPAWFGLGDKDIATHLVRTRMLAAGNPLSAVTAALCDRWHTGITLLPASDDRLETHVVVDSELPGGPRAIHFQEWWVRHRAALPAQRFVFVGAESAKPAAGVLDAIASADVILIAPSNPVVSIAPILAVGGLRDALIGSSAKIVGVSPIIGAAPVRGMADKCLAAIDVPCTAAAVGSLYGARPSSAESVSTEGVEPDGLLDAWLVDIVDADAEIAGLRVVPTPLWMTNESATSAIVRTALSETNSIIEESFGLGRGAA